MHGSFLSTSSGGSFSEGQAFQLLRNVFSAEYAGKLKPRGCASIRLRREILRHLASADDRRRIIVLSFARRRPLTADGQNEPTGVHVA
jgi:hypothetical protein